MGSVSQRDKRRQRRSKQQPKRRLVNLRVDEISLVDNPAVPSATFSVVKRDDSIESGIDIDLEGQVADNQQTPTPGNQPTETPANPVVKQNDSAPPQDPAQQLPSDPPPQQPTSKQEPSEPSSMKKPEEQVAGAWMESLKSLQMVAGMMKPSDLHVLASLMEHVHHRHGSTMAVMQSGIYKRDDGGKIDIEKSIAEIVGEAVAIEKASRVLGPSAWKALEEAASSLSSVLKGAKVITTKADEPADDPDSPSEPAEPAAKQDDPEPEPPKPTVFEEAASVLAKRRQSKQDADQSRIIDSMAAIAERMQGLGEQVSKIQNDFDRARGKVAV